MRSGAWILVSLCLALPAVAALNSPAAEQPSAAAAKPDPKAIEFFESKIRPLLSAQCFACHTGANAKGQLDLRSRAAILKGGALGPALVPGDPAKSLLIQTVHYNGNLKMPPQGKLKPQQIADLTAWVAMGAPWPGDVGPVNPAPTPGGPLFTAAQKKFWAFQPVKESAPPAVKNKAWVKSPIDAFILAKLEAKGLAPAAKADKRTLIRRVSFDLTGLPPTPAEVDAFLADASPNAFAKVVDRLLASPAYGERWGRHWLDVVRYADSNGLDENTAFGNAWRYRDYVVNAFNHDKPYDQFIKEQIAGDLMSPSSDEAMNRERLTATGFLVLGPKVLAEPDKQKMVMDIVDEQVDTMGRSVMGLTIGCARCHDHKFDPIPTKDYYSLAGIFKSTRTMDTLTTVARALERPIADKEAIAKRDEYTTRLQAKRQELREIRQRLNEEASGAVVAKLDRYLLVGLQADVAPLSEVGTPDLKRPGTVVLEAEKFARGDVKVSTNGSGQGIGIVESAGRSAAFTEYEFELPKGGEYQLAIRYASGETRPVKISLDGKLLKSGAADQVTGGFGPSNQEWHGEIVFTATAGKHVLRVDQSAGSLPHLDKIAFIPVAATARVAPSIRARTGKPEELARAHGLDVEVLRRSAAYLLTSRQRGGDPVFEPWHLLSELPEAQFAESAERLVTEWKAAGKTMTWLPPVAELFSGDAPKSLAEAAERYRGLFARINESWNRRVRESKDEPKRLNGSDQEALRRVLYGDDGAFLLNSIERFYPAEAGAAVEKLKTETAALEKQGPPPVPMVLAVEEAKEIGNVKVHIRGSHLTLGDEAPRQFLQIVAGEKQTPITGPRSGRLELAEWLARPDHPLTARVMVNRIWQHHLGEGLVRSPDNFGKLGEAPTHPELLDWLAKRFVQKGWSVKAMHRLILLSNTYQMGTAYNAKAALADPENRLQWRFNRRRLEVEAIRDSMLAVSGQLDRAMGGTLLKTPNFGYVTNDQSANQAQYDSARRSIYLPVIRNAVYDVFQIFDFVEPSTLNGKRAITTVAPQALFLLNGEFVMDQARAFAQRLLEEGSADDAARIRSAYPQAFGRAAAPDEVTAAQAYLRTYETRLEAREKDAAKRRLTAWQSFCHVLMASNEFVYVN